MTVDVARCRMARFRRRCGVVMGWRRFAADLVLQSVATYRIGLSSQGVHEVR